jgi:hypothetical protein
VTAGRRSARAAVAGVVLAGALMCGGCGLLSVPADRSAAGPAGPASSASGTAAAIARTRLTHELPTPSGHGNAPAGAATPAAAVAGFAAGYVNWRAATVAGRLRALAAQSVGQARAAMRTEAAEVAGDRELRAGRVANAGQVEAVAAIHGSPGRYAVVTRERTTADAGSDLRGLAPAWHVALAAVHRLDDGRWVVSRWQPEG